MEMKSQLLSQGQAARSRIPSFYVQVATCTISSIYAENSFTCIWFQPRVEVTLSREGIHDKALNFDS